ncbi:MAG: SRPBCC family protein [Burkholderiales bacterium]|nr:SRPBCC family protein [Burkholderiales bacterium]
MIKITLLIIAVLIAGVLLFAATKPDTFQVRRAATIKAPPEKVYPLINDFKQWAAWSPWDKKDAGMKRTFGAISAGKGATYAWDGNKDVGRGVMEIVEAVPPSKIRIKLDFEAPFEAHNIVTFTLEPRDGGTEVTWLMEGPASYFTKIIHVFFSMDKMVGGDFEAGLAAMKAAAEK